jgi:hypothetical protein
LVDREEGAGFCLLLDLSFGCYCEESLLSSGFVIISDGYSARRRSFGYSRAEVAFFVSLSITSGRRDHTVRGEPEYCALFDAIASSRKRDVERERERESGQEESVTNFGFCHARHKEDLLKRDRRTAPHPIGEQESRL